jgi:hypothetical protein
MQDGHLCQYDLAFFFSAACFVNASPNFPCVRLLCFRLGIWGFDNMSLFENLSDFLERDSLRKSTGALELIAMNLKTAGKVPLNLMSCLHSLLMLLSPSGVLQVGIYA